MGKGQKTSQKPDKIAENDTKNSAEIAESGTQSGTESDENGTESGTQSDAEIESDVDCQESILNFLKDGEKKRQAIFKAVRFSEPHIKKSLDILVNQGKLERVRYGYYAIDKSYGKRTEEQNVHTINRLLNLYDKVLDEYAVLIEAMLADDKKDLEDKAKLLNNFRSLASMADTLMKRWYLVHRGYDSNSRQAQEDAKAKTRKAEQEALENAPLEDQIEVVGHFKEGMIDILKHFPMPEQENQKV